MSRTLPTVSDNLVVFVNTGFLLWKNRVRLMSRTLLIVSDFLVVFVNKGFMLWKNRVRLVSRSLLKVSDIFGCFRKHLFYVVEEPGSINE